MQQIQRYFMFPASAVLLLLLTSNTTARAADQPVDVAAAIIGEWHGISTCTDRVLAPGCNDEIIVYVFSPIADSAGKSSAKIALKADKVVDGKRLPMGEFELTFAAADKTWSSEFRNERVHILWSYQISGDTLSGTLRQYPSLGIVRRVVAQRKSG